MSEEPRPAEAAPPSPPYDVVVVGAGRVGGSLSSAFARAGHHVLATLARSDDPAPLAKASVVVIAVPDDALAEAAAVVARAAAADAVVAHTSGLSGLEPLRACGPLIAAVHPAVPVASSDHRFDGAPFGVTCDEWLWPWCEALVSDLGGRAFFVAEAARASYHAALVMASNFAVTLAGDAADLLGGHELLVPLLEATVQNIARLGPDAALTGPVVRGDAGTVDAHLRALPPHLHEVYVANARRALVRATAAGRLGKETAEKVRATLEAGR